MSPGSEGWIDHACPVTVVRRAPDVTRCSGASARGSADSQRSLGEHRDGVDGAPLTVEAKVRGLPDAAEALAEVDLRDLSLPVYIAYVPAEEEGS